MPCKAINYKSYWQRSILSAIASSQLANLIIGEQKETAYMAGLFQDIGILAMDQVLGSDYSEAISSFQTCSHIALTQIENRQYNYNHAEVGAYILNAWHLPTVISQAVADSHSMEATGTLLNDCVAVSGWFADIWMKGQSDNEQKILAESMAYRLLSLDEQQINTVIHHINIELTNNTNLFPGVDIKPLNNAQLHDLQNYAQQVLLESIQTHKPITQ